MIYDRLSPRQKQALDLLMEGELGRDYRQSIADKLQISVGAVRGYLRTIWLRYGIVPHGEYAPRVRLVYLRAKELGLIQ